MPITVIDTKLDSVKLIEPRVFGDERGFFMESWNQRDFDSLVKPVNFIQDNHSRSKRGVVRGLHFQLPPHPQAKLVRCVLGSIFDVAVDIRKSSPTYGQWVGFELSAENKRQLWIPEGFAHGFCVLTPHARIAYKCDAFYTPQSEGAIDALDKNLAIDWKVDSSLIFRSEKDRCAISFAAYRANPAFSY